MSDSNDSNTETMCEDIAETAYTSEVSVHFYKYKHVMFRF